MNPHAQTALAILADERARWPRRIANGAGTAAERDQALGLIAALVRFVGGDLLPEWCGPAGEQPHWIDLFAPGTLASEASGRIGAMVRRAATQRLAAHTGPDDPATPRTRALLRLDDHVSVRCGMRAIGSASDDQRRAA